jgi:hypothetical protein
VRKRELERQLAQMMHERNEMASDLSTATMTLSLVESQFRIVETELNQARHFLNEYRKVRQ